MRSAVAGNTGFGLPSAGVRNRQGTALEAAGKRCPGCRKTGASRDCVKTSSLGASGFAALLCFPAGRQSLILSSPAGRKGAEGVKKSAHLTTKTQRHQEGQQTGKPWAKNAAGCHPVPSRSIRGGCPLALNRVAAHRVLPFPSFVPWCLGGEWVLPNISQLLRPGLRYSAASRRSNGTPKSRNS